MQNCSLSLDDMNSIQEALRTAIDHLTATSPSAQLDAEILLGYCLKKTRTFLYTYPEKILAPDQQEMYQQLISKRAEGQPIAYLTHSREFWSLPLSISKDTLIPRPETELLVELSLSLIKSNEPVNILELGTGSGAIAIALALERPDWQIIACDINEASLAVACQNVQHYGLSNVQMVHSDWFSSLGPTKFNAIISNPPYIASSDPHLEQGDVRFEPKLALISGPDGLDAISHLIENSYKHLLPGGVLLLEHGFQQKAAVALLLAQQGYENIQCWKDTQGNDRVSGGWQSEFQMKQGKTP